MQGTPSIVSILMRSGTVGSEAQRRIVREQADYLIEPPMPDIGLRDWKKFDQAVKEGYETARASIEKNGVPLTNVWSDGPALAVPKSMASAS
jgi:NTE family protein